MFQSLYFTQITAYLLGLVVVVVVLVLYDFVARKSSKNKKGESDDLPEPPSPRSFPIIGHMHLLGGYEVPYEAFTELGKKYGNIVKLRLGSFNCVVVNEQENIREVLITKGNHFDSRPNFERYQQLFCGNRSNSLAFCDWSDTQKIRREMLRAYAFPRAASNKYKSLESIVDEEVSALLPKMGDDVFEAKSLVLKHCANIFLKHFCSKSFDDNDPSFVQMVDNFDDIFWEVNQGYAADFLPFLMPLHHKNLAKMNGFTRQIRTFVLEKIIGDRYENFRNEEPADYVECLIQYLKNQEANELSWDAALFALEDIIGGHSAVGNFLMKLLGFLVKEPEVQRKMQEEIDAVAKTEDGIKNIKISDRAELPYTEGVIFEAIRLIASPIVPRVANQDSSINGYRIKKDTVVFLNNLDLSMSEKLWDEPEKFKPERFITNGRFVKPEHFLPFGGGKRSCMGYRMVQLVSFGILSRLLQNYTIQPVEHEQYRVEIGSLALPKKTFAFRFVRR